MDVTNHELKILKKKKEIKFRLYWDMDRFPPNIIF